MSEKQMKNLDVSCAELGSKLADIRDDRGKQIEEKVFNEALAVLEEQGPYAMFLYLQARHSNVAGAISKKSLKFLKDIFGNQIDGDILNTVKKLADNLDDLLFARDLLLRALSYARYHLKAKEASTP